MPNVVGFDARAAIEHQAREWLIRLDADEPLTAAENSKLREWMDRSPTHREELQRLAKLWSRANVLTELAVPLAHQAASPTARFRSPPLRWALGTLAVLASIALVAFWFRQGDGAVNGTYGTAIGQQQTIPLSDGSSIQLNTDSQVQVAYSEHLRRIRLLRGEAFFTVAHDTGRAFEVYAADGMVRAVGTAFSVQLQSNRVKVTVTNGIVDLAQIGSAEPVANDSAAAPTGRNVPARQSLGRLKAGQTTIFGDEPRRLDVQELPAPELQRQLAWHQGYLVFDGQPLSEVVEQINRYSPVALEIADPELKPVEVGGRFRIGDLDAVLEVLRTDFGIEASQVDERNIRLRRPRSR